ncbi:hypothetical protein [Tateyamaria sp.]|uniref:hypothetical protein n=1 Tax=Tateyamaria sp. TaxID=1929288 RepID=UPI003B21EFBB
MLSWVRTVCRAEEGSDTNDNAWGRERVTRQEIAALFADELGYKVPQKRTEKRGSKPRRFVAGRQFQTV